MSTPAITHKVRPKASSGKWEHVTDAQLADLKKSVGEKSFPRSYEVKPVAEKPADLPEKPAAKAPKEATDTPK